ncbi:MAG: hypothetical protein JWR38_1446 [Mucilaginibacter sp.]|nr:hypothetical protein [Mucilaginibacter sp.]
MNKTTEFPHIISYNATTRKFCFSLPTSVCDNLLLSYSESKEVTLCHRQREKLEELSLTITRYNHAAETFNRKESIVRRWKITIAVIILNCICILMLFKNAIIKVYPWFQCPLYIGLIIIGIICLCSIFISYLFPGLRNSKTDTLERRLELIELHRRIKEDFSC